MASEPDQISSICRW